MTKEQRDECMSIRKNQQDKRKHDGGHNDQVSKVAALESKIKDQELQIAKLTSHRDDDTINDIKLPPPPPRNPLKPPTGFTQRKDSK